MAESSKFSYSLFSSDLEKMQNKHQILVTTINQYSFMLAKEDKEFRSALQGSDVLLPDGVGIIAAIRLLRGQRIRKIAGADVHRHFLEKMNREGGSCFYLGSSDSTLKNIERRLASEYPSIKFGSYSPPYKAEFTDEDNAEMINAINLFEPNVLFVGMTAPKQEKWAYLNKERIDAKVICCIGAVFDFYAGTVQRPSSLFINLGLEWLGRLLKEPKRMWKRYLYYGPAFVYVVLKEKITW
jgi:N-acetylglucosaminyldiphosphoundecaprenol N-acetyl-beta-D-mannosaminyltransferase